MPTYAPQVNLYQLRYFYNVNYSDLILDHQHNVWVAPVGAFAAPGSEFSEILVRDKSGSELPLSIKEEPYRDLIIPIYNIAATFVRVEVWAFPAQSQNSTFISAAVIDEASTNPAIGREAQQRILTARTSGGRTMRYQFEEPAGVTNSKAGWTGVGALRDYLLSGSNITCDRWGDYFIAALSDARGVNEANWRRRFRQS